MRYKFHVCLIILVLFAGIHCIAQTTFEKIYKYAKSFVAEMEDRGFEIVHLDFNILTSKDNIEETRRSLSANYLYLITVYGDPDRIQSVSLDLSDASDEYLTVLKKGEMTEGLPYKSTLEIVPSEDITYRIAVTADKFKAGEESGRFFMIVAKKTIPLVLESFAEEEYEFNTRNSKSEADKYSTYSSSFEISSEKGVITHQISNNKSVQYTVMVNDTPEDDKNIIVYRIKDESGEEYIFKLNNTEKTIIILRPTGKEHIFSGKRYFLKNGE